MTDEINDVFGGAARAEDYFEEDTTSVAPHLVPRTTNETPTEGLPALRPMPTSPERPEGAPMRLAPKPAAVPSDLQTFAEAPVERSRDETLSVLFGGAASGITSASTAPTKSTKGLRGLLRLSPSAAELAEHKHKARCVANETIIRQATWTRHVRILLANKKGGTGKTPLSILLGGVIAAIKGGSVAIWEVSDDPGPGGVGARRRHDHECRPARRLRGPADLVRDRLWHCRLPCGSDG